MSTSVSLEPFVHEPCSQITVKWQNILECTWIGHTWTLSHRFPPKPFPRQIFVMSEWLCETTSLLYSLNLSTLRRVKFSAERQFVQHGSSQKGFFAKPFMKINLSVICVQTWEIEVLCFFVMQLKYSRRTLLKTFPKRSGTSSDRRHG